MVSGSFCLGCGEPSLNNEGRTQCLKCMAEDGVVLVDLSDEEMPDAPAYEAAVVRSRTRRRRDQHKHHNPGGASKRSLEQWIAAAPWKRARIA